LPAGVVVVVATKRTCWTDLSTAKKERRLDKRELAEETTTIHYLLQSTFFAIFSFFTQQELFLFFILLLSGISSRAFIHPIQSLTWSAPEIRNKTQKKRLEDERQGEENKRKNRRDKALVLLDATKLFDLSFFFFFLLQQSIFVFLFANGFFGVPNFFDVLKQKIQC
jgi:hypothetical protein